MAEKDWALVVVPDGAFIVLMSRGRATEAEMMVLRHQMPFALRDRVLVVDGTRFQAAA